MGLELDTIHCGDCLDWLKTLPDGCVDAVVTDPPYGIGKRMKGGTWGAAAKYDDFRRWDVAPSIETLTRIIAKAGTSVIWGGNYFPLPPSRCWLVWDKHNAAKTMADVELAWTNLDKPAKRFRGNIGLHRWGHPTEKPVELMIWAMEVAGIPEGATVLDPFMGSGTTAVACIRTGRHFLGCEISPEYCAIAEKRIKAARGEMALFDGIASSRTEQAKLFEEALE